MYKYTERRERESEAREAMDLKGKVNESLHGVVGKGRKMI